MKLCIICPGVYPLFREGTAEIAGGAEAQLKTLGLELNNHGFQVSYIVDDYGQDDIEIIEGIKFHKVPFRYMGGSNVHIFKDWFRFIRSLNKIDADIHMVKVPRNILFPLALFSVLKRRKAIYIGQSDVDSIRTVVKQKDSFVAYWFYRIGLFFASTVVSQTLSQKVNFRKTFNKESIVIPSVVTLPGVAEYSAGNSVLWVGNSSRNKQPELFLEIARSLPDITFRMIMSLANDRPNDRFIKEPAASIQNLEYLGFVPFQKIHQYYEDAALLVCTSTVEGFPNTFLQAWQYAAPVVSLTFDPDNIVSTNRLGKISGNLPYMICDIQFLMSDEGARKNLAENGLRHIGKHHTVEVAVDSYTALFNRLTDNKY